MKFIRILLISAGVALILIALTGTALRLKDRADTKNASLRMTILPEARSPGQYTERRNTSFPVTRPQVYEFTPSAAIRKRATRHWGLYGITPRNWYTLVPAASSDMPLVILLHGAGRDGLSMIEMWQEVSDRHGVALLAPNSFGSTWPFSAPNPAFLHEMIEDLQTRHAIDPERIYLFGHSDGAAYAQLLLNRSQGPWQAAALHAGYLPAEAVRAPDTPKPYRLYLGDRDHIFPVVTARDAGQAMARNGHDNSLVLVPGHTHWFYTAGPEISADAWQWLDAMRER